MANGTMKVPVPDLYKFKVRSMRDQRSAAEYIQAQANRWCQDNETSIPNSIVLNKIVYYSAKTIHKDNPDFLVETGWFRYGPCFEDGRIHEDETRRMSLSLVSEGPSSSEIAAICKEHIARWNHGKDNDSRFREYLDFIYSEKCDEPKLKEYYIAKHELSCLVRELEHLDDGTQIDRSDLRQAVRQFDRVLFEKGFSKAIGLGNEESESIIEFTNILYNHVGTLLDGSHAGWELRPFRNHLDQTILGGLSHLNYAMTFCTLDRWVRRSSEVRSTHTTNGHKMLGILPSQNRVFFQFV